MTRRFKDKANLQFTGMAPKCVTGMLGSIRGWRDVGKLSESWLLEYLLDSLNFHKTNFNVVPVIMESSDAID